MSRSKIFAKIRLYIYYSILFLTNSHFFPLSSLSPLPSYYPQEQLVNAGVVGQFWMKGCD